MSKTDERRAGLRNAAAALIKAWERMTSDGTVELGGFVDDLRQAISAEAQPRADVADELRAKVRTITLGTLGARGDGIDEDSLLRVLMKALEPTVRALLVEMVDAGDLTLDFLASVDEEPEQFWYHAKEWSKSASDALRQVTYELAEQRRLNESLQQRLDRQTKAIEKLTSGPGFQEVLEVYGKLVRRNHPDPNVRLAGIMDAPAPAGRKAEQGPPAALPEPVLTKLGAEPAGNGDTLPPVVLPPPEVDVRLDKIDPPAREPWKTADERMLCLIRPGETVTTEKAAGRMAITKVYASVLLNKLLKEGKLESEKRGVFRRPEA